MHSVGAVVYPNFELLDLYGPLEMFGWRDDLFSLTLVGQQAGPVASNMGPSAVAEAAIADDQAFDILLIPGGWGPRMPVDVEALPPLLARAAGRAGIVMTVCTGSALLAASGFLDGRRATTNKAAFRWVQEKGPRVDWVADARWVEDGNVFSSSGVSAGMDMALAVIRSIEGDDVANMIALGCEYDWHRDSSWDPFASHHGLV